MLYFSLNTPLCLWYLYKMVTKNMLRTYKKNRKLRRKIGVPKTKSDLYLLSIYTNALYRSNNWGHYTRAHLFLKYHLFLLVPCFYYYFCVFKLDTVVKSKSETWVSKKKCRQPGHEWRFCCTHLRAPSACCRSSPGRPPPPGRLPPVSPAAPSSPNTTPKDKNALIRCLNKSFLSLYTSGLEKNRFFLLEGFSFFGFYRV